MPDALPTQAHIDSLPPQLPYPLTINIRNSDLGVDESAKASRLGETGVLATIKAVAPPGTVFFTVINLQAMNTTARGLMRVISQRPLDDGIGVETLFDFVELSDDARTKIQKLMAGNVPAITPATRNFATDQLGVQPVYQRGAAAVRMEQHVASTERSYFEPAPLRQQAKASSSTKFWGSLGVTAYVIAALVVIAFFPAGRAIELMIYNKIAWSLGRMWYWANHVGDVKLYNNT